MWQVLKMWRFWTTSSLSQPSQLIHRSLATAEASLPGVGRVYCEASKIKHPSWNENFIWNAFQETGWRCSGSQAHGILGRPRLHTQCTQSAGPVRFLIFCSISIFLMAIALWQVGDSSVLLVQLSRECTPPYLYPLEYQVCSSHPGRSHAGPAF